MTSIRPFLSVPFFLLLASLGCGESTPMGDSGVSLSFVNPAPLQLGGKQTYTVHATRRGEIKGPLDVKVDEVSLVFSFEPQERTGVEVVSANTASADPKPTTA